MAINRDKILKGAEKLVQRGKIEPAIREYEKLLKLNPNDVNTINRIGDLHNRIGQVDRAVELYERIADSFAADGFANKAIAIFKKINRLAPDRVEVFERLADLYIQQGLVVEAKDQFSILTDWYLKKDDLDNAVNIQRKLIQVDPENHIGHLRLADLLFRKGNADEAIDVYDRLGTMLLDRGKVEEAERLYRHALEQDPPTGEFLLPICEALVDSGKLSEAREFLLEAQKRSPESTAVGILDLKVALAAGESRAAVDRAQALMESHPDEGTVASLAGRAYLGVGEVVRGKELLLPIAHSRLDSGDRAGAQEVFRWLIKALPSDRDVLKLGMQALSSAEDKEMIFTLKAGLADSYFQEGERDESRRVYADLILEEPDNKLFQDRLRDLGVGVGASTPEPVQPTQAGAPEEMVDPEPASVLDVAEELVFEIDADEFEVLEVQSPDDTLGFAELQPPAESGMPEESPDFDVVERLAEANVFAKYGLIDKALNHLETILHFFPSNDEVREKLVFLAVEGGRADLAAREAGPLIEAFTKRGDHGSLEKLESALPGLIGPGPDQPPLETEELVQVEVIEEEQLEVLEFDEDLGDFEAVAVADFDVAAAPGDQVEGIDAIEMEKVDLESFEVRPPEVVEDGIEFEGFDEIESTLEGVDEPLTELLDDMNPVEPLPAPATPVMDLLGEIEQAVKAGSLTGRVGTPDPEEPLQDMEPSVDDILSGAIDRVSGPPVSDLQQMDSFLEHSLYEDATRLMRRLESEHPESSDVAERRLILKSKGFLLEEAPQVGEASADLFVDEEEAYVDLAAELEEEMAAEEALVEKAAGPGDGEVDLEDVFREFQKGVAEQLSEEDADTHFNLGIAYKEMGLLPEAIREFQIASKDHDFFVECCSMVGVCYIEQGLWDQAAGWYQRALEAPELGADTRLGLKYELANCLEGSGDYGGASEFFKEIKLEKPAFRDVTSRVDGLAGHLQAN